MNKKNINPANIQIRRRKEKGVHAIEAIDSMDFGALQSEYYRRKLGSTVKGAGIATSLVAEARTTILQAECKR